MFFKNKKNTIQKQTIDKIETSDYFVNIFKLLQNEEAPETHDDFRIHKPTAPSLFSLNNAFTAEYRDNGQLQYIDFEVTSTGDIKTDPNHRTILKTLFDEHGLSDLFSPKELTSINALTQNNISGSR